MKKLLLLLFVMFYTLGSYQSNAQNLIENWDANGLTGTNSEANKWGWASTFATATWGTANGGGVRFMDLTGASSPVHYLSDGTTVFNGRAFLYRWDGAYWGSTLTLGFGDGTGTSVSPISLTGCSSYTLSGLYEWWNNGAQPTYSISIGTEPTGGTIVASTSLVHPTGIKNRLYNFNFTFTIPVTGNYYIIIKQANGTSSSNGTLIGLANLSLVANPNASLYSNVATLQLNAQQISKTFIVYGNLLTNDVTVAAPAGATLNKTTVTAAKAQCGDTITVTYDDATIINDSIRISSNGTYKAIPITALPTFKPTAGVKYFILQTAPASGKVVGETASLPTLTLADNANAQKFEFVPTATQNVYYLQNASGQYLNYDGISALVYSATTDAANSEWKIEGTAISALNLKNIASNGYLNSGALTSGTALTADGLTGSANIGMKLIAETNLMHGNVIDGSFENAVTDGSPIGTWIPNKVTNLGGSLTSRIGSFGGYQSTGNNCFFMRYLSDATSYDTISHKLVELENGATYNLNFRYKNNTVGEAFVLNVYSSSTANAKMSTATGNIFTTSPVTDGTVNQPEQVGTMTFAAPSTSCFVVFAKKNPTSYFNFYLDSMVLTKMPAATLSALTSGGAGVEGFSPSKMSYNIVLPAGTTVVPTVTGTATDAGATVNITNASSIPGATAIEVTATDGTTKLIYTINYETAISTDASLAFIKTSVGALDPIFNKDSLNYTVIVPIGTPHVDVMTVTNYPNATVSGNSSTTITDGKGTATIEVTAEDGTTKLTYTINYVEADGKNYAISMVGGTDGANSNIDISGLNITSLPYTFEMWIKPNGTQVDNTGIIYHRGTGNAGVQYSTNWQGAGKLRFMTNIGGDFGTLTDVLTTNTWHHVAVVLTETTRTIYLNGKPTRQTIANTNYNYKGGKLYIGWDSGAANRTFKGEIDEVRVWNFEKDSASLADNKLAVLNGSESGLTGYWNFDLKNLSQAVDLSADSLHGKITGGTYVPSFSREILDLATLTVSAGTLYPAFDANVTKYNLLLPSGTNSFDIAATAKQITCTVTGTGTVNISGSNGADTIKVTSANGLESKEYIINYVVNTPLTLKHSYTFEDATANDVVGSAHGTVIGGTIASGIYSAAADGEYINLPAAEIAINKYPSVTMEAYITAGNGVNGVNTMVSYFGNTVGTYGTDYLFLSHKSRAAMSCLNTTAPWNAETGVSGAVLDDGKKHHLVATLTFDTLAWYVDSVKIGATALPAANKIFNLGSSLAYLCKGGYTNDKTWMGSIHEYNIYSGIMDHATIKANATRFLVSTRVNTKDNINVSVYPTITNGNFNIETNGNISNITVYDMTGKTVTKKIGVSSLQTIDVAKAGIYIIKIESKGKTKTVKVVKTK